MTDKDYLVYGKAVYEEIYAMSTPLIDSMAGKVLTRMRKELKNMYAMPDEWTRIMSTSVDVIDVMSVQAHKGKTWAEMNVQLEGILEQYITDRYNEIDERSRLLLKYRYVGDSELHDEVKNRIYARLNEHYATQKMEYMLERFPDLADV